MNKNLSKKKLRVMQIGFALVFLIFIIFLILPKNYTKIYNVDNIEVTEKYNKKNKVYYFTFKKDDKLTQVSVAEVAHSIFYAPQYIADSLGYFEEEGLDVEIILTSGADKVTAAVLSGDVQIGFAGSEATIYVVVGWGEFIQLV